MRLAVITRRLSVAVAMVIASAIACVASTTQVQFPGGWLKDIDVNASAAIQASKFIRHQSVDMQIAAPGVAISAINEYVHIVNGATANVKAFQAMVDGAATGTYATTIDLKRSTGGGSYSSILSAPITLNSSTTALTAIAATITSSALIQGDSLKMVVSQSGSGAGGQPTGCIVTMTYEESEN